MAADPKQELHMLIDQLGQTDAQETLADVHRRLRPRRPGRPDAQAHDLPTCNRAPAIATIDDLHVPLFAPEESAEEFDATLRRWREMPESA